MIDLNKELLNHDFRELEIRFEDIFPKLKYGILFDKFSGLKRKNAHETIFNVSKELWNKGYDSIFNEQGFYDKTYEKFSGHCHQCTPALGLILKVISSVEVSYLECYRIKDHFLETGIIEKVSPEEETNEDNKKEFCEIGRIPYCCLEIKINGEQFYLSGKHIKPEGDKIKALLTPICYRDMIGIFSHQDDNTKSGIYLQRVIPKQNPNKEDFDKKVVWMKQTTKDPKPEYFATYLRMELK